jgi:hypothetical protein
VRFVVLICPRTVAMLTIWFPVQLAKRKAADAGQDFVQQGDVLARQRVRIRLDVRNDMEVLDEVVKVRFVVLICPRTVAMLTIWFPVQLAKRKADDLERPLPLRPIQL